jgi:murein DD-endopeptidase MepM/ murein hydrolase activator NlpD
MRRTPVIFILALGGVVGCARTRTEPGRSVEAPNCAWQVCLEFRDTRSRRTYWVVNREPVPATVRLTFHRLENLRPVGAVPVERVTPAYSTEELIQLRVVASDRSIGARPAFTVDLGSSDTPYDADHPYTVPFGGTEPRELTQGFGGRESHMGGMRYSLDFAMPVGTPVLAARSGVVVHVQDGFTEGGSDPDLLERANIVVVAHSDGSMASYGHLHAGIPVSKGDPVAGGQLVGFSGATGFAGRPHLHFHVGTRLLGDPGRTVPIRMIDGRGRALPPNEGTMVPPGVQPSDTLSSPRL